jgi:CubicO group peptidase (beta-lactamase class C family)
MSIRSRRDVFWAAVLIAAVPLESRPISAQLPRNITVRELDTWIDATRRDWRVPGLAVGIVYRDSLVYARGFGFRDVAARLPVDERTVFAIASATKAFTATAVAMLVSEKRLSWDDPVTKYLPRLKLSDPYVTRELTVRDLLSHRVGLPRVDWTWFGAELSRTDLLARLQYITPAWSFRSHFGYQNLMYLTAGELLAAVSGRPWETEVRDRILLPLGMTNTTTLSSALANQAAAARSYAEIDDTIQPIPYHALDNLAAAGGMNSNLRDMSRWLRFQLRGNGKFERLVLDSAALAETRTAQTVVVPSELLGRAVAPQAHLIAYGLGWFLSDYHGRLLMQHAGDANGMSSMVALIPEEQLGVAVLTNLDGSVYSSAAMYHIFDQFVGAPDFDWSRYYRRLLDSVLNVGREATAKLEAARIKNTKPSRPLEEYVGSYSDDLYGEFRIRKVNGVLVAQYGPRLIADLEHWHFDTFRGRWRNKQIGKIFVTFHLSPEGKPEELVADFEGPVGFKRASR